LSGKLPYHHLRRDGEVFFELHRGVRPPRPSEVADDEHWALIGRCWADDPLARPSVADVSECVGKYYDMACSASEGVLGGGGGLGRGDDGRSLSSRSNSTESLLVLDGGVASFASPQPLTLICAFVTTLLSYQVVS